MKDLTFKLKNTTLSKDDGSWSNETDKCIFKFEGDVFRKCKAVASFELPSKVPCAKPILNNGICEIPEEVKNSNFFRLVVVIDHNGIIETSNCILITKED